MMNVSTRLFHGLTVVYNENVGFNERGSVYGMISVAIVEDEDQYAKQLEEYLRRYGKDSRTAFRIWRYADGDEIAENYSGGFDLILMDIQMAFMDGMTAAEKIREKDRNVLILFITNRTDYAIRGYQVDALDYIVKPVTYFAFKTTLDRALSRLDRDESKVVILNLRSGFCRLHTDEIYYVESQGHTLVYHTARGEYSLRDRMQSAEEKLAGCGFFRCNKGYLVNLRHVDSVVDGMCRIQGDELLISRARRTDFMEALTEYFGAH